MRTRPPFCPPAKLRPRSPPPPSFRLSAETCRFARWPQERQALAAAKSLRLVVSAFVSSGRWPPARAMRRHCGMAETPILRLSRPPPIRAQNAPPFCLNTPQSTGLVSTTLHKAGSLLRENQNPVDRAFVIRVEHERQTLCFVPLKTRRTFSGRFRAACGGSLRLRLRRASLWSLRSKECSLNL